MEHAWPTPETTKAFLLMWVSVLICYAVVAIRFGGRESSVSVVTYEFCAENPIIAFAVGIVFGHLLWRL